MLKVTVLGCGSSGGVPFVGCKCPVCTSTNPKNKRTRVSIRVESPTTSILVDTSPDLRSQCLNNGITRADNIIFTHAHADHVHGIDDVRSFNFAKNAPLDTYADAETMQLLQDRFGYVFRPMMPEWGWYRPCLIPHVIEPYVPFTIGDIEVLPIEQKHGKGRTIGLRFGNFAYCTDTNGLPEASLKALEGIDTWIVDCLRYDEAPTHSHLAMTLGWIERIKPRRAYLTHMNHSLDYDKLLSELPDGVEPSYDGLRLEI